MNQPSPTPNLPSALADLQAACADLTVRLNQTYAELASMEARVRLQEEAVRRREDAAAQLLAEAEREARSLGERSRQYEALAGANGDQASESTRAIEQEIARRLAELGQQQEQLEEREERLAELVRQQQTERRWLNRYAQGLTTAANELTQTLDELQARPRA